MITLELARADKDEITTRKAFRKAENFPELVYTPEKAGEVTLTIEGENNRPKVWIYQVCGSPVPSTETARGAAVTSGAD